MLLGARQFFERRGAPAGPTARDYVQTGLIAMWDGIENAGWGVHDANATTWADLSWNGYDLELKNGAHFDDNSLVTANRNYLSALATQRFPYATVEACGFCDSSRNSSVYICGGNSSDNYRMLAAAPKLIQPYSGNYQVNFSTSVPARSTWAATYGTSPIPYVNGSEAAGTISSNGWTNTGKFGLSGRENASGYNFVGNYYCVRLYSRALTAAEIAANYAIDKVRFNLP